ncbi:MAG: hypothetical protein JKY27_06525 [Magnetovibrio sp.]|nr:hypothetical protein [Magnetovibrio sp.]
MSNPTWQVLIGVGHGIRISSRLGLRFGPYIAGIVLAVVMLATATIATAAGGSFRCVLNDGETVLILEDRNLQNVAVARRDQTGRRTIVTNPTYMELFQPATQWFWLAHECAHQQLGHTLGNYGPDREQQADCYAVRQMIKHSEVDLAGLKAIQNDISKVAGDGKAYRSGPERAAEITACALTKPG